jgi:hypothetical protein
MTQSAPEAPRPTRPRWVIPLAVGGASMVVFTTYALTHPAQDHNVPYSAPTATDLPPHVNREAVIGKCIDVKAVGERIVCVAKLSEGTYTRWGGGHIATDEFNRRCPDPRHPAKNSPHGAPYIPENGGISGNPSTCAEDTSSYAVNTLNNATGADLPPLNTAGLRRINQLRQIPESEAGPGDLAFVDDNHTEIIVKADGNTLHTIGARKTGTKISEMTFPTHDFTDFRRFNG